MYCTLERFSRCLIFRAVLCFVVPCERLFALGATYTVRGVFKWRSQGHTGCSGGSCVAVCLRSCRWVGVDAASKRTTYTSLRASRGDGVWQCSILGFASFHRMANLCTDALHKRLQDQLKLRVTICLLGRHRSQEGILGAFAHVGNHRTKNHRGFPSFISLARMDDPLDTNTKKARSSTRVLF